MKIEPNSEIPNLLRTDGHKTSFRMYSRIPDGIFERNGQFPGSQQASPAVKVVVDYGSGSKDVQRFQTIVSNAEGLICASGILERSNKMQ